MMRHPINNMLATNYSYIDQPISISICLRILKRVYWPKEITNSDLLIRTVYQYHHKRIWDEKKTQGFYKTKTKD